MSSSIQQFVTTPIQMAFTLEDHHLRQLDRILRTDKATVEYIVATQSLVFNTYESVEDLIRAPNLPDDPLIRLEAKRITGDTHVTLLFASTTDVIKLAIMNDDSQRPDFRHQISSEIAAWLEQTRISPSRLSMAWRPAVLIPVMAVVAIVCVILGITLSSSGTLFIYISMFVGIVVIPVFIGLVLWTQARFFSVEQFNFGSGRKSRRDEE